jgi:hypothetical protein
VRRNPFDLADKLADRQCWRNGNGDVHVRFRPADLF